MEASVGHEQLIRLWREKALMCKGSASSHMVMRAITLDKCADELERLLPMTIGELEKQVEILVGRIEALEDPYKPLAPNTSPKLRAFAELITTWRGFAEELPTPTERGIWLQAANELELAMRGTSVSSL